MKAVIQRVLNASVQINKKEYSSINEGLLVFLGITKNDTKEDVNYLVKKIINLRIFADSNDKMNFSIQDIKGEMLIVSQFTLYGDCKKGSRPSFVNSANYKVAKPLYDLFIHNLKTTNIIIKTGIFKEDMNIKSNNNGPVTIILES